MSNEAIPFSAAQAPTWQIPAFDVHEIFQKRGRYALGIPVLNENGRIQAQLRTIKSLGIDRKIDVVIADGGSTDGSLAFELLAENGVRALLTKRGPGKLSAQLRMFFAYALLDGYDGLIIIDGNNKDGVEAIPEFVARLEAGWDYIQGSRYRPGGVEENTPFSRKLAVRLLHAPVLSLAARFHYTDTTNGFRALSRNFLLDKRVQPFREVFDTYNLHFYLSLMAPRLGFRVCEIPVTRRYPKTGQIPSKIKGMRANLEILKLLFKTVRGDYAPPVSG
ncbi:MAG TPA: glycosyltransferase family 2 protein [Rhizomicrobium sp.]|nr:glycosyltransferase family 2 protein [Rhizomicrobium sp.]